VSAEQLSLPLLKTRPVRNAKRVRCAGPKCHKWLEPERSTRRFCSTKCRVANHRRAKLSRRMYPTPPQAVEALLQHEQIPALVWEPCCGTGSIVRVLRAHGHHVIAHELIDYASPEQDAAGRDFLRAKAVPPGVEAIVTNPPFEASQKFVEHAIRLCPVVIMLPPLTWLESARRTPILENGKLARVLIFRNRLPMMHRHGYTGRKASNARAFAWYVWRRDHPGGPPTSHRISWQ
jgi:hypothetical protein